MSETTKEITYFQDHMPGNICFGCGTTHTEGLNIKSYWEGNVAVCKWTSQDKYQLTDIDYKLNKTSKIIVVFLLTKTIVVNYLLKSYLFVYFRLIALIHTQHLKPQR